MKISSLGIRAFKKEDVLMISNTVNSKTKRLYRHISACCTNPVRRLIITVLCSFTVFIAGCSGLEMKHYVRPDIDLHDIKKVAVLPLENFTSDKYASEKIASLVIINLLSRGIDVVEPGEVTSALRRLKIRAVSRISTDDVRNLGRELNIDALIIGAVETYGISRGISVSYPEATISLRLIEPESGIALWSIWHTAGGAGFWTRHFGVEGRTLDETSIAVVREALDTAF